MQLNSPYMDPIGTVELWGGWIFLDAARVLFTGGAFNAKPYRGLTLAAIKVTGQNQYQTTAGHSLTAGETRNSKEGW